MSYAPKLAAALSGATIRQLAYWRKPGPDGRPILTPEHSASRPIDYSFRDVIALRTCVRLRQEASLQKIRRALDALRIDLGLREHLSSYQLVADGSTIYLADASTQWTSYDRRAIWLFTSSLRCCSRFTFRAGRSRLCLSRENMSRSIRVFAAVSRLSPEPAFHMTRLPR